MNTNRHAKPAAAFVVVCVVIFLLTSCIRVVAQDNGGFGSSIYQHRMATLLQTANSNVAAHRLAMGRLHFLQRLNRKYSIGLYEYGGHENLLLFPTGRSDRAYLVLWTASWPATEGGGNVNCIFCFQQKEDGKITLVYRVNITDNPMRKESQKHPGVKSSIKSLQDYVHSVGYDFLGPMSRYAKADLADQREYVGYTDEYMNKDLKVFLLSTGEYPHNPFENEHYSLGIDPITGADLKQSEFYRKYGLPVSLSDLKTLQPQFPQELLVPPPDPFAE